MRIEVANIPKSGMAVEEEETPQIMGTSLDGVEYKEPIRARLSVWLVGHTLVVRGRLSTPAVLECNRCLRAFHHQVIVQDYTYSAEVRGDETVDLTESIREHIILSLPMKRLCSAECKGLCPLCGQDLNASACDCRKSQGAHPFSGLDHLNF
jgi:uncharacterized protein